MKILKNNNFIFLVCLTGFVLNISAQEQVLMRRDSFGRWVYYEEKKNVDEQAENYDGMCSVCREAMIFGSENKFSQLPCGHFFHDRCWCSWAAGFLIQEPPKIPTCPECRQEWTHDDLTRRHRARLEAVVALRAAKI